MTDHHVTDVELWFSDMADAAALVLFVFVAGIVLWVLSGR